MISYTCLSSISSSSSDSAVVTVIEMRNDVRREVSGGWSTRRDNDTRISKFTKSCLYISFMSYNEDLVLEVIRSGEGYYHANPCFHSSTLRFFTHRTFSLQCAVSRHADSDHPTRICSSYLLSLCLRIVHRLCSRLNRNLSHTRDSLQLCTRLGLV